MSKPNALLIPALLLAATAAPPARADDDHAGKIEEFVYAKTPHGELKTFVHFPEGWKAGDHRPAIVFFFGGGWRNGNPAQFESQAKYLAGRGMVAARADYRVKSRQDVTPVDCVADARAAVRWLRENAEKFGIDPDRIVASGGSAGGHIAACTGTTPDPDANAAVSSRPNAMVLFNPVLAIQGERILQIAGIDAEAGKTISPTAHVTEKTPPTLILFGTEDPLMQQAQPFLNAAKAHGVRAELFTAEGVGHGFFNRPPWQDRTIRRVDEFLGSLGYLQGPPTIKISQTSR